ARGGLARTGGRHRRLPGGGRPPGHLPLAAPRGDHVGVPGRLRPRPVYGQRDGPQPGPLPRERPPRFLVRPRRRRRPRARAAAGRPAGRRVRPYDLPVQGRGSITMKAEELRALQAPVKARYREDPTEAQVTLRPQGKLGAEGITCKVETGRALVEAGLHPATGGDGLAACSGDMLLEALVACAGVTLRAVATALDIPVRQGTVTAEGDLDFRGT